MRVTRRSMLSGIGAGTAALLARPLMRECFADALGPPKRILFLYMPNTSIRANWVPDGGRNPIANTGDPRMFTLKMGNETLAPMREQMTMVTGLDLKNVVGCNHGAAIIRFMTGGSIARGQAGQPGFGAVNPSFDQVLATSSPMFKGTQI